MQIKKQETSEGLLAGKEMRVGKGTGQTGGVGAGHTENIGTL